MVFNEISICVKETLTFHSNVAFFSWCDLKQYTHTATKSTVAFVGRSRNTILTCLMVLQAGPLPELSPQLPVTLLAPWSCFIIVVLGAQSLPTAASSWRTTVQNMCGTAGFKKYTCCLEHLLSGVEIGYKFLLYLSKIMFFCLFNTVVFL